MKLPIKKIYFDKIKDGTKKFEYRDAHITFICEETGEELRREVIDCSLLKGAKKCYHNVLEDDVSIMFILSNKRGENGKEERTSLDE